MPFYSPQCELVAQSVEHVTFNHGVAGSNPAELTTPQRAAAGGSFCEWKGAARYWTIRAGDRAAARAAWSYPDPTPAFADIRDHLAVYAGAMDSCFVGDEAVTPQPGGFYGGWITKDLKGPFKGGPGSLGW